jgi:hypothetical protein
LGAEHARMPAARDADDLDRCETHHGYKGGPEALPSMHAGSSTDQRGKGSLPKHARLRQD